MRADSRLLHNPLQYVWRSLLQLCILLAVQDLMACTVIYHWPPKCNRGWHTHKHTESIQTKSVESLQGKTSHIGACFRFSVWMVYDVVSKLRITEDQRLRVCPLVSLSWPAGSQGAVNREGCTLLQGDWTINSILIGRSMWQWVSVWADSLSSHLFIWLSNLISLKASLYCVIRSGRELEWK